MSRVSRLCLAVSGTIDRLTEAVGTSVRWLTLLIPIVCFGYAMARKLFPWGHNGFSELQWYLFATVYLLAAGYTLLKDQHVRVDFFWRGFSVRTRCLIDLAFLVPLWAVCVVLSVSYWDFWTVSVKLREGPEDVLTGLERWPIKLALFIGFALLSLQVLSELLKRIACLAGWMPASRVAGLQTDGSPAVAR